MSVPRYFTPEEANAALDQVRPLVERMVEQRRSLGRAQERRAAVAARVAGNGGGLDPEQVAALDAEIEATVGEIQRCVEEIAALGATVKDVERGLVDFPARRGDEVVLLCWQLGEQRIDYWHRLDDGFAGRRPLPL